MGFGRLVDAACAAVAARSGGLRGGGGRGIPIGLVELGCFGWPGGPVKCHLRRWEGDAVQRPEEVGVESSRGFGPLVWLLTYEICKGLTV